MLPVDVARARLEVLDQAEHREELADLVGQIGIARGVFVQRRSFAPAAALEELLGEILDRRLDLAEETDIVTFPMPAIPEHGAAISRARSSRSGNMLEHDLKPLEGPDVPFAGRRTCPGPGPRPPRRWSALRNAAGR